MAAPAVALVRNRDSELDDVFAEMGTAGRVRNGEFWVSCVLMKLLDVKSAYLI